MKLTRKTLIGMGRGMKVVVSLVLATAMILTLSTVSWATLFDRGGGLIYDDVLNITWLQDANLAESNTFGVSGINADGTMSWNTAQAWIAAMNAANYLGFSDWRLPTTPDAGTGGIFFFGYDGIQPYGYDYGYNMTTSEMGYMFYVNLGNLGLYATNGTNPQSGYGLANVGLFLFPPLPTPNPALPYWSGTQSINQPTAAWYFDFYYGTQAPGDISGTLNNQFYAWAVRDGDVAPVSNLVPVSRVSTYTINDDASFTYSAAYTYTNPGSVPAPISIGFSVLFHGATVTPTNFDSFSFNEEIPDYTNEYGSNFSLVDPQEVPLPISVTYDADSYTFYGTLAAGETKTFTISYSGPAGVWSKQSINPAFPWSDQTGYWEFVGDGHSGDTFPTFTVIVNLPSTATDIKVMGSDVAPTIAGNQYTFVKNNAGSLDEDILFKVSEPFPEVIYVKRETTYTINDDASFTYTAAYTYRNPGSVTAPIDIGFSVLFHGATVTTTNFDSFSFNEEIPDYTNEYGFDFIFADSQEVPLPISVTYDADSYTFSGHIDAGETKTFTISYSGPPGVWSQKSINPAFPWTDQTGWWELVGDGHAGTFETFQVNVNLPSNATNIKLMGYDVAPSISGTGREFTFVKNNVGSLDEDILFQTIPPFPVTTYVSLNCPAPGVYLVGTPIAISGIVSPQVAGLSVSIDYTSPSGMITTHTVTTGTLGAFTDNTLSPSEPGSWTIKARLPAQDAYLPSQSATCSVIVNPNSSVICGTLSGGWLPDIDLFEFHGSAGEHVKVTLAPNPSGTYKPGSAVLALFGVGVLKTDTSALPNTVAATLPKAGTYYVTVSEKILGKGNFSGAYCVKLESSQNAWQTFIKR